MKTALIFVHVLTYLVYVNVNQVYSQSTCCDTDDCCDDGCNAPDPYNVTLAELVNMSPLYVNFFPAIPLFAGTDNICFTYVPLIDKTYLATLATVFSNGYNKTESYIKSSTTPGVLILGSSTCVFTVYVFDYLELTDCPLYLAYVCFNYGDCSLAPGDNIPVFGFSTSDKAISQDCLNKSIDRINRAGIPSQNYFIAPFAQGDGCVANACTDISS